MDELGFVPVVLMPAGFIVGAYLLGSVSFGILISRAFGLPDPRTVGSATRGQPMYCVAARKPPPY